MLTFDDLLEQITGLLQRDGRVTYRAVKRRFGLDDDYLADLCGEIVKAKRLAVDEDGEVLVWVGEQPGVSSQHSVVSSKKGDRQRSHAANPQHLVSNPQPPSS